MLLYLLFCFASVHLWLLCLDSFNIGYYIMRTHEWSKQKRFYFTKRLSEKLLSKILVLARHRNALRENHPPQVAAKTQKDCYPFWKFM